MVILCREELFQRGDLRDDSLLELFLGLLQGDLCFFFLGCVVEKDDGPVLGAVIRALGVQRGWVMDFPEDLQDLGVRDDLGIEGDLNDLGMASGPITDLFVGWVWGMSSGVT